MRLLRRLHFNAVGLAVRVWIAVVSLIRSACVILTLLRLRGVLWRRLLVVVVVVGLSGATWARGPACTVEGLLTGLTAAAGGYAAERTLVKILKGDERSKMDHCLLWPSWQHMSRYGVRTLGGREYEPA